MEIKVVNCSKESYWYADKIGQTYKVAKAVKYPHNSGNGFQIIGGEFKTSFVDEEDAEIVFEEM